MSQRTTTLRHTAILKKLGKGQTASFEDINDYLKREGELAGDDLSVSKRTFQRDLISIRSIYDIDIQCNSLNLYYIADEGVQQEVNTRMLEAFNLFNSVKMAEGISPFIHFEKRIPQGTEHIYGLLHAIQNRYVLQFDYQKFWEEEISHRITEPYGLKEFESRWYLLAKDRKDGKIKTFGLERMQNITPVKEKFIPQKFDAEEMFRDCFGIITEPEQKTEKIILSFDEEQGKYVKSFPLHESQLILKDDATELRIELTLKITYDLLMEILYYGDRVKVISPDSLIKRVCEIVERALKQYEGRLPSSQF
jgi:predicted DNA-binding transcriptional regulator YafY